MLKKITGVIVTETKYSETSKILNIITEEGIVGVIAKGALRLKSPLRAFTTKLTYGTFHIYYKEDKLSLLKEVDIVNNFYNIRKDLKLISYFSYLTDLTYQIMKENYDKKLFNNYINSLILIENNLNPLVITNIIEVKSLDYLGVGLDFNNCISCMMPLKEYNLDIANGGYLCNKCYNKKSFYSEKAAKMLKMYYLIDLNTIHTLKISDSVINEIDHFLTYYYDDYTGLYLKSKKILKDLKG